MIQAVSLCAALLVTISAAFPWMTAPISGPVRTPIAAVAVIVGGLGILGWSRRSRRLAGVAGLAGVALCLAAVVSLAIRDARFWSLIDEHAQYAAIVGLSRAVLPGFFGSEPTLAASLERVRVVREAVGPGIDLMCDINQLWSVNQAIEFGRRAEPYHLFWLEDPVAHDDYAGLARVANALTTPVAGGEYLYGITPFRHMLEARSVDIVMIDLLRVGGIANWLTVAGMAEAFNVPVVSHLFPRDPRAPRGGYPKRTHGRVHAVVVQAVRGSARARERRAGCAYEGWTRAYVRPRLHETVCGLKNTARKR